MENWQEELAGFFKLTGGEKRIAPFTDMAAVEAAADEIERLHNINTELLEACKAVYSDAINHQHKHNNKMFPKRFEAIQKLKQAISKAIGEGRDEG